MGRFTGVDPIADRFAHLSVYNYASNRPVNGIDLHGLQWAPPRKSNGAIDSDAATYNHTSKEHRDAIIDAALDEIPIVGEIKSYQEGGIAEVIIGAAIGGYVLKKIWRAIRKSGTDDVIEIFIDGKKHPQSAKNLDEAIKEGKSNVGIIDRKGADARRKANLKGIEPQKRKDRDEAPPAVIDTGEKAKVKHIDPSDNRGAGGSIGNQIKNLPDGTKVKIVPKNLDKK